MKRCVDGGEDSAQFSGLWVRHKRYLLLNKLKVLVVFNRQPREGGSAEERKGNGSLQRAEAESPLRRYAWQPAAASNLHRQIGTRTPLVPGAIVVHQVGIAQHGEREQHGRCRHTAVAIGHHRPIGLKAQLLNQLAQLFGGAVTAIRPHQMLPRQREGARNASGSRATTYSALILPLIACIYNLNGGAQQRL